MTVVWVHGRPAVMIAGQQAGRAAVDMIAAAAVAATAALEIAAAVVAREAEAAPGIPGPDSGASK